MTTHFSVLATEISEVINQIVIFMAAEIKSRKGSKLCAISRLCSYLSRFLVGANVEEYFKLMILKLF